MSYSIVEGSTVRFYTSTPFTAMSGTVVDPDVVTFTWNVQGGTPSTYTYTTGAVPPDPTHHIIRDSAGTFHVDLSTDGYPGTWAYEFSGQPGVSGEESRCSSSFCSLPSGVMIVMTPGTEGSVSGVILSP